MRDLEAIARTHGVFLRREAIERGYDDNTIARAVRKGVLVRVRHGAYAFAEVWGGASDVDRHMMRAAAVARAAKRPPVLSHTTAALCHGADTWDLPLEEVHVTRPERKAGRREAGVARHRGRLRDSETTSVNGLACTDPVRTALDVTTITDVEHALVVVCSILHSGLATEEQLRSAAEAGWAQVPGSLTTNLVLSLADRRIHKPGEARTLYALWAEGIPRPELQFKVHNERGVLVAELDFAWPERRVWLEFDGRVKYRELLKPGESATEAVVREKTREDEVRRLTGWICIRVMWENLRNPAELARRVRRAFAAQTGLPA